MKNCESKLGLFDTVASYNENGLSDTVASHNKDGFSFHIDFESGAETLHLNEINTHAKQVVHLVAENEYRENYALTKVAPKWTTIVLPGSHSDIGGNYPDNDTEKDWILSKQEKAYRLSMAKSWFINEGWYKERQLTVKDKRLIGNRHSIRNAYGAIPLQIMRKQWEDSTKILLEGKYALDIAQSNLSGKEYMKERILTCLMNLIGHWTVIPKPTYLHLDKSRDLIKEVEEHLGKTRPIITTASESFLRELLCYTLNKVYPERRLIVKTAESIIGESHVRLEPEVDVDSLKENMDLLIDTIIEQIYFRILRNECLHWSAVYNGTIAVNTPGTEPGDMFRPPYRR